MVLYTVVSRVLRHQFCLFAYRYRFPRTSFFPLIRIPRSKHGPIIAVISHSLQGTQLGPRQEQEKGAPAKACNRWSPGALEDKSTYLVFTPSGVAYIGDVAVQRLNGIWHFHLRWLLGGDEYYITVLHTSSPCRT